MPSLRGQRSSTAKKRKTSSWVAKGGLDKAKEVLARHTTVKSVTVGDYPGQFVGAPTNSTLFQEKFRRLYPGMVPRNLPSATTVGRFLVPMPSEILSLHPLHPPYLVARFDQIVKEKVNQDLISAWDAFSKLDVQFPPPDKRRSKTPALHLGVWELYNETPRITKDSVAQPDDVIVAMDRFLRLIQDSVGAKLRNILKEYYPQQFDRQMRAYDRIKKVLANEFATRPALDFQGFFFTVAVKEGSSELVHLDFNDHPDNIAWIVPLGAWEGGEFCVPQLGIKVPIRAGQVIAAMTRNLAHCSAPKEGLRVILTLFSDKFLLNNSDKLFLQNGN